MPCFVCVWLPHTFVMCALICCAVSFLYFVISFCLLKFSLLWMMYSLCSRKAWLCAQRQQKFSSGRIYAGHRTICYYKRMSAAGFRFCFFFPMYFYLFPPMSLILRISLFTFLVLLGFLFQSLPFVCLSRWTWGSGGCSIITGVSLGVVFSPYFFFLCTSITR